jgi:hypothetical protein
MESPLLALLQMWLRRRLNIAAAVHFKIVVGLPSPIIMFGDRDEDYLVPYTVNYASILFTPTIKLVPVVLH